MSIPTPNVLDRWKNFLTFQFRNDPNITGYRIRVADNLNNAYGNHNGVGGVGTTALFDIARGATYLSPTIRRRGTGISGDITRDQTRATFDPNEFFGQSPEVPPDDQLWFVRTQVRTLAANFPVAADATNQSEILVVQNPTFFSVPRPALTLAGTAPAVGAVAGSPAPPEAMIFRVPAYADALVITNHGTGDLFFAAGRHQPLMLVDEGTTITHSSGMTGELVFAAAAANPDFSIVVSTIAGTR